MVSHHPAKFGGHRQCDSVDIMFLVAESICLFLKGMGWKHKLHRRIINSDPGHTRSKQQLNKDLKITIVSLFKSTGEKDKGRKERKTITKHFELHANAIQLQCKLLT